MDDLQQRIRELPPEQLALLVRHLPQDGGVASERPPPEEDLPGEPPPLSSAQRRLWFLQQLQPDSAAYYALDAVRLQGPLDAGALQRSLDAIVARHAVLRTTFGVRDGEPRQIIAPAGTWPLERVELQGLHRAAQEIEVRRHIQEEQWRGFDLARGPLVRAVLLTLGPEEHVLLLSLHHVVADGWSIGILRQELSEHYRACRLGVPAGLSELPCQYAHFAVWQHELLSGQRLAASLAYWREQLRDLPLLALPADHPRPPFPSYRGGAAVCELPRALSEAIAALGRQESATLFMALMAAFQVLLARYTEQADVAVGTPIANRGRHEWEGLIGFFVNTLVLRSDLRGNPTFREALRRVRDTLLQAYANQDLPFERLVEELRPERDLSRNPLFQVMFAVHHLAPTAFTLGELTLSPVEFEVTTSRFDLEFDIWEHPQGLRVAAFYSLDLFDRPTVVRLLENFERLLQGIAADPDRPLSELPLLADSQRRQLLTGWNPASALASSEACLHQLFELQAERTPEAAALWHAGETWSYRRLNARAEQLAGLLRSRGVGPDVPVGLCLSRSPEMVAAILGVLKAGGAYVPLEPDLPAERIAFIMAETRAPGLLTESSLVAGLPDLAGVTVTCVDEERALPSTPATGHPDGVPVRPDHLAYIMYTSGSMGRPKGVAVSHRNVVRLFQATQPEFRFGASDVGVLFHSYAFDFSVWELWAALLFGGRLVIVPWFVSRNPREFCRLIAEQRVTVLNQTPTAFAQLLREPGFLDGRSDLRWVIFGGERLDPRALSAWFDRHPQAAVRLVNMYGITETTVHVTLRHLSAADASAEVRSPIGSPLADLQIYILDRCGNPVPQGVPGEVHVGGGGLARGYWRDPALTAERFLPHPFTSRPGARLYRTGDRARRLSDGSLEFLGRCDAQLKIRGVRMEPGEIEAALRSLPEVREVLVLAVNGSSGEPLLVAYVVPAEGATVSADGLQRSLRLRLPSAMIPSAFVVLAAFPRTSQGKVDRGALPPPGPVRPDLSVPFAAPRTPIEQAVAEIWQETLRMDRVGVDDNFFELGGHSLQAARVVARLRDSLEIELPLQTMFAAPKLNELATQIERILQRGRTAAAKPPGRVPRDQSIPLSFAQQRLWFLHQSQPRSGAYHVPLIVELQGPLSISALQQSLDALVERHESLRTTFPHDGGRPVQRIASSGRCPLTEIDLRTLPPAEQDRAVQQRAAWEQDEPFDLETGPLMRACVVRREDEKHVLFLTMHHVISDGWSIDVLRRELAECYRALTAGTVPQLPELPVQYADFAVWQRAWLQGEVLDSQLGYWRRQLADLPTLRLPADRQRPTPTRERGAAATLLLPLPLKAQLADLNRREGATLFMTLLAAFQILLARYSGQTDIAVGSPVANRSRREFEGLIGFFVNTLVMRTQLDGDPSFRGLLRRVRQMALAAYTHQDLPFELLVEDLQPDRLLDRNPLFQVMFTVQNNPRDEWQLPGLTVRSLPYAVTMTRFDLQWDAVEHAAGLQVVAYYSTDLFQAATIHRMLGHYQIILEQVLADPDRRLSELSILPAGEQQQLLSQWNDTRRAFPRDACLHEVFEARVQRTPDAIAVVCGDRSWTYGQLNARANRLARQLRQVGVGPDDPVGLQSERGLETVAAMLGILKAGGAYLPLAPGLPARRLRQLLDQARPRVMLVRTPAPELEDGPGDCPVIGLTELLRGPCRSEEQADIRGGAVADNLAYIMYTSGSTGVPKGVGISHRSVMCRVTGADYVRWSADDVVAQASDTSFDAATFEVWGALLNGARLAVIPADTLLSPLRLPAALRAAGVTLLFVTTALFHELARHDPAIFGGLRWLLFGGEPIDPARVRDVLATRPPTQLLHMYGPTETTTFAAAGCVEHVPADALTVPIGGPIANTQIYVLDGDCLPVPIGIPGEIWIGGPGLARGYRGNAALTAEKFIPHPWADEFGARLYRTGDLARWRPDGQLELLGRRDEQVKIRGFRVELGDVRAALREHAAVQDCLVTIRADEPGRRCLVAYVITDKTSWEATEQRRLVQDWQAFYDDLYARSEEDADPRFNIVGWTSSYTGGPLPAAAMQEQVDQAVARILRHRPRRVLEIGCGTGLLLLRLAPHCERCWGTDISQPALDSLRRYLQTSGDGSRVMLWQRTAEDFSELAQGSVDAVVLNSVVQYFPGIDYLRRVLEGAARVLTPQGVVFLGDLRSLPLWETFQTAVELVRAPASLPAAELRQRVAEEMAQETELLVHPEFFLDLQRDWPALREVRIEPKRGRHANELTQFRYDVTLGFGSRPEPAAVDAWRDWRQLRWSADEICEHLVRERPPFLALRHIANARVETAAQAVACLRTSEATAGQLRDHLLHQTRAGIDPDDLWAIEGQLPYAVQIDWSAGAADGRFDTVLLRADHDSGEPPWIAFPRPEPDAGHKPVFGNPPLKKRVTGRLARELREHLKRRLPEYMLPAAIVLLDEFPLTVHGKVDRSRLPPPERSLEIAESPAERPPTPTEQAVARIWAEVLRLRCVGLHDNFFDLGGHSLMAMQVVTRLREAFHVELSVRNLFEAPTVAELALLLTERKATAINPDVLLQQLTEVERLSDQEAWSRIHQEGGSRHE